MTTADPFSRLPVPSESEFTGTVLETPSERAARTRALDAITRDDLLHALTGFWLDIGNGFRWAHGQVKHPDKVADALFATLSRIAAERRPDIPRPPVRDALREEIQRYRAIHYDHATEMADEGKDGAAQAFGRVGMCDEVLGLIAHLEEG